MKDINEMTEVELIEEILNAELGYSWDDLEDEDTNELRDLVRRIHDGELDYDEDDEDNEDNK